MNFTSSLCRYAASVDDILEEEEHYADQLKEYLFYTEALRFNVFNIQYKLLCVKSSLASKAL